MIVPNLESYDGTSIKNLLIENVDVVGYVIGAYLVFVFKGPAFFARLKGKDDSKRGLGGEGARYLMALWNLFLSAFSICGASVVVPALINHLMEHGFHSTTCEWRSELVYSGPVGFWMTIFNISKVPELIDTFFLELSGKPLPFLHWYHHTTVLIFCWHAQATGSTLMLWVAAMNYSVHSVMYLYFALSTLGFRSILKPIAPFITIAQISQMVGGCFVSTYCLMMIYNSKSGCSMSSANARMGFLMYTSYLPLFSQIFIGAYLTPKEAAPHHHAHKGEKQVKAA